MFEQFSKLLMLFDNKIRLFIILLDQNFRKILQNASKKYIMFGIAILGIIVIVIISYTVKPNNQDSLFEQGNKYFLDEKYGEAIVAYTAVLKVNPTNIAYLYGRGNAYLLNKEYDNAIVDFTNALILKRDYPAFLFGRGNAYLLKEDYSRAIDDYELILRIDPYHTNAKTNLKLAHGKIGVP